MPTPQALAETLTRPTSMPSIIWKNPCPGALAEDVVGVGHVAVEDQLGGVDALVPELVDLAGDHQSRRDFTETGGLFDEERGQVAVRLVGAFVGSHQHRHQCRAAAVGQPHLLAVDRVGPVGVALGPGADRGDVGTEFGLGHRERAARLAGRHPRQEPLLLRLGAVLAQHVRDDEVGVDHPGDAHPAARELLDAQRVGQQRLAEAAVLLGDHQPEQAHLAHLIDDGLRVGVGVLEFLRGRDDLLVDELPYGGDDFGLELGKPERLGESRHAPTLSNTAARPCPPPMHMVSSP